tara:strand:+ start:2020 stop:2382 length:363 start_codon:yes stop_codon:yes gene_type:complete
MAVVNQYEFFGVTAKDLSGAGLNMFGTVIVNGAAVQNPVISETYIIKSLRVLSVGIPIITVINNGVTVIKTVALTTAVSEELLSQPLIVEGGTVLKVIASTAAATDVGISFLNIKKSTVD